MFSLTPDRLTAAKEMICGLMDPNGCLKIVIDSRLAAEGFRPDEMIPALDMIGRERRIRRAGG